MIKKRQEVAAEITDAYDEVIAHLSEITREALAKVKSAYRYAINNPQLLVKPEAAE